MDAPLRAVIGQLYCCGTINFYSSSRNTPDFSRGIRAQDSRAGPESFDEAGKPRRAGFSLT